MADFKVSTSDLQNDDGSTRDNISSNSAPSSITHPYLTAGETKDPNSIIVEISAKSPLVVLYGAANSGKTMTLIRLTRFLRNNKYLVEPVEDFRPTNSIFYKDCCKAFLKNVNSNIAASSNEQLSFMLLNITQSGERVCQILEAPGEHYFAKDNPTQDYPTYIHSIINNNELPKIWAFILELNWESQSIRDQYATKISGLFGRIRRKDNIILLCNKADLKGDYIFNDKPDTKLYYRDCREQYPAIFNTLEGRKRGGFFSNDSRKYDFIVFSAGSFTNRQDGDKTYIPSNDNYPGSLWKIICNAVKGGWFN